MIGDKRKNSRLKWRTTVFFVQFPAIDFWFFMGYNDES